MKGPVFHSFQVRSFSCRCSDECFKTLCRLMESALAGPSCLDSSFPCLPSAVSTMPKYMCVVRQMDVRIVMNTDKLSKTGHCWPIQDLHDRLQRQKQKKNCAEKKKSGVLNHSLYLSVYGNSAKASRQKMSECLTLRPPCLVDQRASAPDRASHPKWMAGSAHQNHQK